MPTTESCYQPSAQNNQISAKLPSNSNYIKVHSSRIYHIAEGSGMPIPYLHGNPTASYVWRSYLSD